MAKLNVRPKSLPIYTHEGGRAKKITPEQQLRRSVLSCFLWEDEFYTDGQSIYSRIRNEAAGVSDGVLAALAIEARTKFNLRHVSLYLAAILAKPKAGTSLVSETIAGVIQRADEVGEYIALYAKAWGFDPRVRPSQLKPHLSKQVRLGIAKAFPKFSEYSLAKYDRASQVRLRDAMLLCHPKPKDEAQAALWKRLLDNNLDVPDTWEVGLTRGGDKREVFTRLLQERKLGYLALLRNLRNMEQAGVDRQLVEQAIRVREGGAEKVLPFRFIAAARAAPSFEPALDASLSATIDDLPKLSGRTAVLVDVSNSMNHPLSAKSDINRLDAACALASVVNAEHLRVFSFSSKDAPGATGWRVPQVMNVVEVPPRRGMAGVDAIRYSQTRGGTLLFSSVDYINREVEYDRLIVITDEQAFGDRPITGGEGDPIKSMPDPKGSGYLINVASAKNGVGYGKWNHLDGFSEAVIRWIVEYEAASFE